MIPKYRLKDLGWYNFETLCKTILKAIIGNGVSSFGGSKDKGRDATFHGKADFPNSLTQWNGKWIFQVKFSEREKTDNFAELYATLKKEILNIKARQLNWPDNYILLLNFTVTNKIKDDLKEKIKIDIGYEGNFHLLDGSEICEYLDLHPQIRKSYPQLIGLTDINKLINKNIYEKSKGFIEFWKPKLVNFVSVEPYFSALNKLTEHNFVVLDGPPEVGKSYIGAAITLSYATEGFEVIFIENPDEIYKTIEPDIPQVYFADDAIGSIIFDPDLGNIWSRNLPYLVNKLDKTHKLIWTTRSYILKDALVLTKINDELPKFPGVHEVLVEIDKYKYFEKGLILYNHIRNSSLNEQAKNFIKTYANRICYNSNVTPERIRQLTEQILGEIFENVNVKYEDAYKAVCSFLDDPGSRFTKAFNSLSKHEKEFLLTMLDSGKSISVKNLRISYEQRIK